MRIIMSVRLFLLCLVMGYVGGCAASLEPTETVSSQWPVVTQHRGVFNGKVIEYSAAVEETFILDIEGKPGANMVATAYTVPGKASRPVIFVFNGGPIVSSLYLHMGSFGPKRVSFPDDVKSDPSTFKLVDNNYSILDVADLVFVDPASTGFSRVAHGKKPEDYFSVEADGQQVAAFIATWLRKKERLDSPVFVFGESYGTVRAPEVGRQLANMERSIFLEGMVLFGQAVNIIEYAQRPENIISYVVSLPTLAAIGWYHNQVDRQGLNFEEFLAEARTYARTEYLHDLFKGDLLTGGKKKEIAQKLEGFTGISADYYVEHDLKISKEKYRVELLKKEGLLLGRSDARYVAPITEKGGLPDPSNVLSNAMEKAYFEYLRNDLNVPWGDQFLTGSPVKSLLGWDWSGSSPFSQWRYSASVTEVFNKNPNFRVLVGAGHYDTMTTTGSSEYLVTQSGWPEDRVFLRYYQGGHMSYSVEETAKKLSQDLRAFILGTMK